MSTPLHHLAPPDEQVDLDSAIDQLRQHFNVPKTLTTRMVAQESGGNDAARSPVGASGRFQVMPATLQGVARETGKKLQTGNPLHEAYAGLYLLRQNYDKVKPYAKSERHAWMAATAGYHGPIKNVIDNFKAGGDGIPDQGDGAINTRDHVYRIFKDTKPEDFITGRMEAPGRLADRTAQESPPTPALRPPPSVQAEAPDTNYFPQVSGLDAPSVTPPPRKPDSTARLTRSPTRAVASRAARPAPDSQLDTFNAQAANLNRQLEAALNPTQAQNRVRSVNQVSLPEAAPPRRVDAVQTFKRRLQGQMAAPTTSGNIGRQLDAIPSTQPNVANDRFEAQRLRRMFPNEQFSDRSQRGQQDMSDAAMQARDDETVAQNMAARMTPPNGFHAESSPEEKLQFIANQFGIAGTEAVVHNTWGLPGRVAGWIPGGAALRDKLESHLPRELAPERRSRIVDRALQLAGSPLTASEQAGEPAIQRVPSAVVGGAAHFLPSLPFIEAGATSKLGPTGTFAAQGAIERVDEGPAAAARGFVSGGAGGELFKLSGGSTPVRAFVGQGAVGAGQAALEAQAEGRKLDPAQIAASGIQQGYFGMRGTHDNERVMPEKPFVEGVAPEDYVPDVPVRTPESIRVKKGGVADGVSKPGEGNTGVAAPSTPAQALADFVAYARKNNVRLTDGNLAPPTQVVADELTSRLAALHQAGVLDNEIRAALSAPEASDEVPQTMSVPPVPTSPQVEAAGGQAGRSETPITTERRATVRTPETDLQYAQGTMESIGGTLEPEDNGYRLTVGGTSVTTPDIPSAVAKAREFATQREIMSQVFPTSKQYRHADFGVVTEAENQSSVSKGHVRVTDEAGTEHVIQRPNGRGQGNNLATPIRGQEAKNAGTTSNAEENVASPDIVAQEPTRQDVGRDDLAAVKREADEAWAKIKPLVEKPATLTRAERQRQAKLDKAVARINRPARTRPAPNSERHSLSEFVNLSGGIRPDADNTNAGEVRRLSTREIGGRHIGLVNKNGRTADEMAELVHERGYFTDRPDPNALLAAIEADARGKQHYSAHNEKANAQVETEYNAYVQAHPEFGAVERKFEAFHNDGQAGDLYERLLYDGTESLSAEELNALRQKAKQHGIASEIEYSIATNSLANQTDDTSFNPAELEKADSETGVSTLSLSGGEGKVERPAEQSGFGFGTLESGLFAQGGPTVEKQVAAPKPDVTLSTRERLIREEAARQAQKNTEAFGADTARQLEELAETDDRAGQVAQTIIKERSRVTKPVTDTVQALRAIREAQSNNTPLNDHLKQQGLFGASLTPEVQNLARRIASGRFNISDLSDPVKLSRLTPTERTKLEEAKGNLKRTLSPDKVHDINEVMANALPEVVKIAKYHILNGAREFADFSREMVQQFGEQIRPHLERLHKLALEAIGEKNADRSTVQGVTPTSDTETQGQGEQLRQAAKGPDVSVGDGREGVTDSRASLAERGISSTVGQEVSGPTGTKNAVTERERAFPKSAAAAGFQQGTDLVYDVATNKAAEAKAEEAIKVQGADRAMSDLLTKTETTKDDIVLGETLAKKFAESGEHEREMAVIDDLAKKLTNAGQSVQAASLIAKLSPTGLKLRAQKILNKTQPGRTLTKAEGDGLVETAKQIQTSEGRVKELAPEVERAQSNVLVEELQTKLEQAEAKLAELEKGQTKQGVERIRAEVRRTRRAVSKAELDTEFAAIKGRLHKAWIEARKAKGALAVDPEGAITKALGEMALNRVRAGVNDAAQLVDDIYNALKDDLPGLTRREVQEKVSGYGKTAEPSKEPIRATLRDLKEQMRLALAIEDVEGKQAPRRSGYQRGQSSAKALAMRRELTEKLKASGLEMGSRDPLPAIKRRLQQEIDRNEGKLKQLQQGVLPRRTVRPTANLDAEATKLKGERDALTQQIVAERKKFPVQGPKKPTALLTEITTRAQGKPEVLRGAELFTRQGMNPETWRAEMKQQFGLEGRAANQAYRDAYEVYSQAKQSVTQGQRLRAAEKANPQAAKSELQRLVNERLDEQTKRRKGQEDLAKQFDELSATPLRRVGRGIMEVAGLRRAARTAIDLSWGFRQGKVAFGRHPLIWARGFAKQFPAIKSKATYERMISERELDPDFKYAQRFNLFLATEGRQAGLSAREEGFQTSLAEKIPVISHSERAYNTMADEVRFQWFKQLLHTHRQLLDVEASENKQVFENLAQQINIATGRGGGSEGFLAKHGAMVNNFAFSAQFWASRLKLISQPFNPRNYTRLSEPARVEAWKNFLGYAVVVGGQLALAKASGANVDTDPHSANFLKATWGRLHVDFSAGVQGHVRAALGILKSLDMEYRQHTKAPRYHTAGDIAGTYFRGKESPDIQALHDIFLSDVNSEGFHTMVTGEPVYLAGKPGTHGLGRVRSSYWVQNAAPMIFNDAYEAFTQLNLPTAGAATAGALLGEGVQTYSPRSSGTVTIPELKRPTNRQIDFSQ